MTLTPEIEGLDIYTCFDSSAPDNHYRRYRESQPIPDDAEYMRIISYRGNMPVGRLMRRTVAVLKKRAQ